ncbi:ABC transporter, ATP-binding protein [Hoyosella subflava DQS3-9A1]|uniref:ABC transporter, ATP-binding protein n=1 Tax=Hoyosella subflava (strain DSM 45089 / JCM 17490 / NBRC 109087 / DQS3-9A1) TaxID=443218 RepID=F6ERU7_HOYSD|nr:ABC transporter, ATP-binding protein [Hoyosella subflava DQS3-9A1]
MVLLHQESRLPLERGAGEHFRAHTDMLVSAGIVRAGATVSLSSLGLLRLREIGKRIGELSMGQQRRLDLARVLACRPQVLLLDEPTNHLSIALVDELTEALSATEAAVVISTHDRQMLRDLDSWPSLSLSGIECRVRASPSSD